MHNKAERGLRYSKSFGGRRIPNLLRKYRRVRGLKQKDVARILDLRSASRISRWEKGLCLPSLANVLRLVVVYRVMVDVIYPDLLRDLREEIITREGQIMKNKSTVQHG